ncbi:MAG: hypothetical protein GF317_19720 [Candidatus Lokiarchaeota archaeon]|nr:hypothetical protein [Candidatus Lokiarchaeota archaeon]MBD3201726.1 hypothetical protein [Candidatus Lokiarchaeota archaeon]
MESWKNLIPTPALVLNYNIMEKNMKYVAKFARENNVKLRHHVKTAKTPIVAHIQMKLAGDAAEGIAVAKVGEAEIYRQCGFDDILIANQVLDPNHIERLMKLTKYTKIRVVVDSEKNILDLSKSTVRNSTELEVLIDIDLGMGRTGVKPYEPALKLAQFAEAHEGIKVVGLQGYEGHLTPQTNYDLRKEQTEEAMNQLIATRDLLNENGFNIDYISASGSGTFTFSGKIDGITEIQPGTYVYSDEHICRVCSDFEPAATVLSTITNNTGRRLYTMDAGEKALETADGNPLFKDYPKCRFRVVTEEHTQFKSGVKDELEIGQKVELIPAHICITVNLYDYIHVVKDGEYIGKWAILARGKNY